MKKEKKYSYRLTITKPEGEVAYDNIVKPGDVANVNITETIDFAAAKLILGEKSDKTLNRTFKIRIRRL